MDKKLFLMVCYHKDDPYLYVAKKYFRPIQAGKDLSNIDLEILADNVGENISEKNKTYSELTAHYYAYKNIDSEYIGLMHYRRFLTAESHCIKQLINVLKFSVKYMIHLLTKKYPKMNYKTTAYFSDSRIIKNNFKKLKLYLDKNLNSYDIILPQKYCFPFLTMEEQYCFGHDLNDYTLFKEAIITEFPFLTPYLEKVNSKKSFYLWNMYIMKQEYYSDYHEKLFKILFTLEEKIDISKKDNHQKRVFGFLSERFLNVYIAYIKDQNKDIKIKELKTLFVKEG